MESMASWFLLRHSLKSGTRPLIPWALARVPRASKELSFLSAMTIDLSLRGSRDALMRSSAWFADASENGRRFLSLK